MGQGSLRKERNCKYGNENTAPQAVCSTLNPIGADKEGGTPCRRKTTQKTIALAIKIQADRKRFTEGNEDVSGASEA